MNDLDWSNMASSRGKRSYSRQEVLDIVFNDSESEGLNSELDSDENSESSEDEMSESFVSSQSSRPQTPSENTESGMFIFIFDLVWSKMWYIYSVILYLYQSLLIEWKHGKFCISKKNIVVSCKKNLECICQICLKLVIRILGKLIFCLCHVILLFPILQTKTHAVGVN